MRQKEKEIWRWAILAYRQKKKKELCDSQLNPGLGKNIGDN